MHVINHASLPREQRDGRDCQTVAGRELDGAPFEVQMLQLAPGAVTLPSRHTAARVLLVLAGSGKQRLDGAHKAFRRRAPCMSPAAPNTRSSTTA
jgi:gentisate 1,2-dioxygenase